ncbi:MAG: hypothetical protein KDD99_29835, partial [Bacteroidetes bacterium]|nr:hypothetical protein [Bacteroidota bacterium]
IIDSTEARMFSLLTRILIRGKMGITRCRTRASTEAIYPPLLTRDFNPGQGARIQTKIDRK